MDQRVQNTLSFIQRDSSRRIRLEELSRLVNLSSWRLCHLFKQETGVSIMQFVHTLRMEAATRLLEGTFLSIKEIRVKVGFPDESNFIRAFERAYNLSPSQYRARQRMFAEVQSTNLLEDQVQQDRQLNSKISQR